MKLSEKLKEGAEIAGLVCARACTAELIDSITHEGKLKVASSYETIEFEAGEALDGLKAVLEQHLARVEGELVARGLELDLARHEMPDDTADDEGEDEGEVDDE